MQANVFHQDRDATFCVQPRLGGVRLGTGYTDAGTRAFCKLSRVARLPVRPHLDVQIRLEEPLMENPANAAAPEVVTPATTEAPANAPHEVERFMMPPQEFIRQIYLLCGAIIVLLSLAISLMMVLA